MKVSLPKAVTSFLAWFPLLAGSLLTALVSVLLHVQNQEEDKAHIKLLATQAESLIQERFGLYEYGLRGARGAIVTTGTEFITRKQFENYIGTRDIPHEFPGALGFGFIRKVSVEQEARFIQKARRDGMPHFSIRFLTSHNEDRFVIEYIYPIEPNKQAIGLDIDSETNRRRAALASARENRAYLTEPITLVQADKKARRGVLIMLPIFPSDLHLSSPQEREDNVIGWSYAPLIVDDVLEGLPKVFEQAQIQLRNQREPTPFYTSAHDAVQLHTEDKLERVIDVMGQKWMLELTPNDKAYLSHRWDIPWVLTIGIGMTFLLVLGVNLLITHSEHEFGENDEGYQGAQRFLLFAQSPIVKKTWPPAIATLFVLFLLMSWLLLKGQKTEIANQLTRTNQDALMYINSVAERYERDTLFLANTPPH